MGNFHRAKLLAGMQAIVMGIVVFVAAFLATVKLSYDKNKKPVNCTFKQIIFLVLQLLFER